MVNNQGNTEYGEHVLRYTMGDIVHRKLHGSTGHMMTANMITAGCNIEELKMLQGRAYAGLYTH
jgi:hypothetical protein